MTEEMLSYYGSINYKLAYELVLDVMYENLDDGEQLPILWKTILESLSKKFYSDEEIPELKQILEEHYAGNDSNLRDPEDPRYPHTKLLLSIRDKPIVPDEESWDTLVRILYAAWYGDESDIAYDEDTHTLTMYTGGWSGNEDIIYALSHNIFGIHYKNFWSDPKNPAVHYLRMPESLEPEHQDRTMCRGK